MSNLGFYQTFTTWSKKVGGPKNALLIIAGIGGVIGSGCTVACQKAISKIRTHLHKKQHLLDDAISLTISKTKRVAADLTLCAGDIVYIIERDGDAVLIARKGDKNNPYFISADVLCEISDFTNQ